MFNSHLDSNISLGLNILEGCAEVNRMEMHAPFGQDISEENCGDMMSCAFQTAEALKNLGVTGCYYQMAPMYKWSLRQSSGGPAYWDSVRMLHLLSKYVGAHTKKGEWPLPIAFSSEPSRKAMMASYKDIEEHHQKPLSYTPEIDKYWLGDDAIEVFDILEEPLKDLLMDATEGGLGFVFPKRPSSFRHWIAEKTMKTKDYTVASVLYLTMFFPWIVTGLIMSNPMTNVDWLFDALGDSNGMTQQNRLVVLEFGPIAIRRWIEKVQNV